MKAMALMAALCAAPAAALADCQTRGELQQTIERQWGEVTVGYGMRIDEEEAGDDAATVVEVWVGRAGTWTMTETHPDGLACVVAFGTNWVFVEQPWPDMGELN